jgi:hypothetical protein
LCLQRRFIVTEALFQSDGSLCPLGGVVALKQQYGYRLILDETQSFGSVGPTGRGLTEHCDVAASDVDVLVVTLEGCLASVRNKKWRLFYYYYVFLGSHQDESPNGDGGYFFKG